MEIREEELKSIEIEVQSGQRLLRLTRIMVPTPSLDSFSVVNSPVSVPQGSANFLFGVCSPDVPPAGVELQVSGTGVSVGPTQVLNNAFPGSNPAIQVIYAPVTVDPGAPAGMRTFIVKTASQTAYANGFLEILPAEPDYNFDDLNDIFQRRHFPLFTSPAAAPGADPDEDGAINKSEAAAATDPNDRNSILEITSITRSAFGTTVRWESVPGKRYRILFRPEVAGSPWTEVGELEASTTASEFQHTGSSVQGFYQVEVLQ